MTVKIDTDAEIESIRMKEDTTALTPDAGYTHIQARSDGLYIINDSNDVIGPFITGSASSYSQRATMFFREALVTGSAHDHSVDALQPHNTRSQVSGDGVYWTQSFMLVAGTYTFYALGVTNTDRGIIDWYIDDVLVISGQDWYNSPAQRDITKTTSSITVTGNGRHVLKGIVNGKNGSSSNYGVSLTTYWLVPASDTIDV